MTLLWSCPTNGDRLFRFATSNPAMDVCKYAETPLNDIFKEGYGTLVARMGASLPVRLNTPATGVLDKVTLQFDGERFGLTPNQWLTF